MIGLDEVIRIANAGADADGEARRLIERRASAVRRAVEHMMPYFTGLAFHIELPPAWQQADDMCVALVWSRDDRPVRRLAVPLAVLEDGSRAAAEAYLAELDRAMAGIVAEIEALETPRFVSPPPVHLTWFQRLARRFA